MNQVRIKEIREELGLSQREFAELISKTTVKIPVSRKMSASRVSDLESGFRKASPEVEAIINKLYDKSKNRELKNRIKKI